MPLTERERLALYEQLQQLLGPEHAGALMELLPPTGWNDIATRADIAATTTLLRGEMAELRSEVHSEMTGLRGAMAIGFAAMERQMAATQRAIVLWNAVFALTVWLALAGVALTR